MRLGLKSAFGIALLSGMAAAESVQTVLGHQITVTGDGIFNGTLVADGVVLLAEGVITLDPDVLVVDGVSLITGTSGAGGNSCNAAPFVLTLPDEGPAEIWGPVESCAHLLPEIDGARLVFTSDAVPGAAGETWVWTPDAGFASGPAVGFAATADWAALDGMAGAHPADVLTIAPVLAALKAGLGADYPIFADRISEVGSGDLTDAAYLGRACLKFACDTDWAVLYIDRTSNAIFAAWKVLDEIEVHRWPEDAALWPADAMAAIGAGATE